MGILGILGFLSIFHIIGGAAIGFTLRGLRDGFSIRVPFMLIWGAGFGGLPLIMGFVMFAQMEMPYLVLAQIFIFIGAILVTALTPDWYLDVFKSKEVGAIGFGGIFLLVGIAVAVVSFREEPLVALVFGGIFGGVGAFVFWSGIKTLLNK
ncbi:MAG: hypothetical protein HZC40_21735 [Chloroflexi bacterium]|nr:hypothetical protein [Chloroflexota bacterium]